MKKICLAFNHFQHQDGVSRSALAIANALAEKGLAEITLVPIYTDEKAFRKLLNPHVKVNHVFGFYFHGMSKIVNKIPLSWINRFAIKDDYDIMIGFQESLPIKCIAASHRSSHASKFAWMHCYFDWLLPMLRQDYETIGTVICVSRCNAERLHKELPSIKVDYNYNPIDDVQVRKFGEEPIDIQRPEGLLFVTVGRLSPEKGFGRLLDIMKRLKEEGEKFHLWIIGDGPIEAKLKHQCLDLGLQEEVLFLGRQPNPHKYTSKADVFVCSSFIEGYSTACTEAIMLNVPVVTTSVSGAEEIIEEAGCGKMAGMDDDSLYTVLKEVCEKPAMVKDWKAILQETKGRFSAEVRIRRLINLFQLND